MGGGRGARLDGITVVLLDSYYELWETPLVSDVFARTLTLKLAGYRPRYAYGALPLDTCDFISAHLLVCKNSETGLIPLMGYKSITSERCREFKLHFPVVSAMTAAELPAEEIDHFREGLQHSEAGGSEIHYCGSWTIHPSVHQDRDLFRHLYGLLTSIHVLYHLERARGQERYAFGVLRLRTDKFLHSLGFEAYPGGNGTPLLPLPLASLAGEPVTLMRLTGEYPDRTRAIAERYRELWERRIELSRHHPLTEKKAA